MNDRDTPTCAPLAVRRSLPVALAALASIGPIPPAAANTLALNPSADTTIYEEEPDRSNGTGDLFSGRTIGRPNPSIPTTFRRALLRFDLSAVPAGATIDSASLRLRVVNTVSGNQSSALHRVTTAWAEAATFSTGQGASAQAGDPTWTNAAHPSTPWGTPGGDFVGSASATTTIGGAGTNPVWASAQMAADVRGWVDDPAGNLGWIIVTAELTSGSAKRLGSREAFAAANRPQLTVEFTPPQASRRDDWLAQHFPGDPENAADERDLDGDGLANLFEYAFDLDPKVYDPPERRPSSQVISRGQTNLYLAFTFDPRATDLTYRVEASANIDDPAGWTAIYSRSGAGEATGPAFAEEVPDGDLVRVSVEDTVDLDVAAADLRYLRLVVVRESL